MSAVAEEDESLGVDRLQKRWPPGPSSTSNRQATRVGVWLALLSSLLLPYYYLLKLLS
jgi:hypothetical protein